MPAIGINMSDREPIIGWEAITVGHITKKPFYVKQAEQEEERAYQNMCAIVESRIDDNGKSYDEYQEAVALLEIAHKKWDREIKPAFIQELA